MTPFLTVVLAAVVGVLSSLMLHVGYHAWGGRFLISVTKHEAALVVARAEGYTEGHDIGYGKAIQTFERSKNMGRL